MILKYWRSGIGILTDAAARLWGVTHWRPPELERDGRAGGIAADAQRRSMPNSRALIFCFIISCFCRADMAMAVPPETEITNVARATYSVGSLDGITSESNVVTVTTENERSQSTLEFMRYAPGNSSADLIQVATTYYSSSGLPSGPFEPLAPPLGPDGVSNIDISQPLPLVSSTRFTLGEPIFIRLADTDQNLDSFINETVLVNLVSAQNGESELLRLSETDLNSGIFSGYIQTGFGLASAAYNGAVAAQEGQRLQAGYYDVYDSLDISSDTLTFLMQGTSIFINKSASKSVVSPGDYLQYSLKVENTSTVTLDDIYINDNLPYSTRYQPGSATFDGIPGSDPQISNDGRVLTFSSDTLAPGESFQINYVVEVGSAAKPGELTNRAHATDVTGQISNMAAATVKVREELFRIETFIAGRVFIAECDTASAGQAGRGLAGVRIYLEDGTYAVTDSNGMYHFEGIAPGTHVLQLDREGLPGQYEVVSCEENSRSAGSPYSKFVDLQAGSLWQVDFEVLLRPKQTGELKLRLSSRLDSTMIHYKVGLERSVVPLRNLRLMVMLPEQLKYLEGTGRLAEYPVADPSIAGQVLTFNLGDMPEERSKTLTFDAALCPFDTTAELRTECFMIFDTPDSANQKTQIVWNSLTISAHENRLPSAPIMLSPYFPSFEVKLDSLMKNNLDDIIDRYKESHIKHIYITGHSDNTPINPRSRSIYPDNYALSLARARTVAEYLVDGLDLDSSQFTVTGKGPDDPIAEEIIRGRNDLNRRVDIKVISEKITKYQLLDIARGEDSLSVDIIGIRPGESEEAQAAQEESARSFADLNQEWLADDRPGFQWLWPEDNYNPPIPSLKVAIKHYPDRTPRLLLDGKQVSSLNFSETVSGGSDSVAISIWTGIDLREGTNNFSAVLYDRSGRFSVISRTIHYSGPPVGVEVVDSLSRLIADGREPAIIAVRLIDSDGYPARPGVAGEWSVDPPYMARQTVKDLRAHPLLEIAGQNPRYLVGENGIATLELQPSSRSGEALLRFHLLDREEELRVWLRPALKDWMLVGLAEGTVGYNTTRGSRSNLADAGVDDKTYSEGRAACFARGSIQGDLLLTLALDSRRWNSNPDSNMFRTINPEAFYPLYGDNMMQDYGSSSSRGIFARLEAANYYAMFGDYSTGLNVTELSRYNRTFNGLKFEGNAERKNFNLFLSRSNQAFVKDEIQGDGTSGPYALSRNNIVVNSERVVIETRDRFQNDVIISRQTMRQFLDYDIDYYSGVIFFKRPVPSRDEQFNPLFITVDYESNDANDRSYNYGGRVGIDLAEESLNVGGTYIHEGRIGGYGHLGSIDATLAVGDGIQLKTEFAASKVKEGTGRSSGNAYLIELERKMKKLSGKIFIRNLDPEFGLGQLSLSERGMRKFGAAATYRLRESLILNGHAYSQSYLSTDSRRNFGEIKINTTEKRLSAQGGIRYAEDRLADGTVNRSCQLMAGGSYKIWADRLELRLMREQSIIKNNNPDFPTRTTLGADYHISRHLTFFAQQDFASGSKLTANDTRFGFKAEPWKGARIHTDIDRRYNENAQRLFSNIGLVQAWQINDKLSLNFSLDHGELIAGEGDLFPDSTLTPASGNPDNFTALSLGGSYHEKKWSSTARIEYRDSKIEDRLGITANMFGEPRGGLGLLISTRVNKSETSSGLRKLDGDIRLGFVYRPLRTRWLALNRLDFIFSTQEGGQFDYDNWRLVENINVNCRFSTRLSTALQYGAKYMREVIGPNRYRGYTDLIGLESRYDLGSRWDIGGRLSLLHSWSLKQYQYGSGISMGYSLFKNAWASLGYNFSGFDDRDFSEGNFTARGPFLQVRFKFDDMTVKNIARSLGL
ncbi:MAG TPA: DUF11 domain-containing protein [candidate division Zixibacteria bacterium]|nr:DUF11 domain-containing protein [candidate division Zixibacteria bacterium]